MRRSLRYMDAVKVLAGGENQLIKLLDDASATMLLGAGVFDLFEAREQALRLLGKVLDRFGEKLRGIDRLTRTERIHAAHEVIRITAYFDALADALGEWRVRFSATEQAQLASEQAQLAAEAPADTGWRKLFQVLSETTRMPLFEFEDSGADFRSLSARVDPYLHTLGFWDSLDDTETDTLQKLILERVPIDATTRYHEYLRQLAVDCPEFEVWLNLEAHAATRERLTTGLAELEQLLAPLSSPLSAGPLESLNRAHRAALDKPIVLTDGPGPGSALTPPSLGEGYVSHRFRLAFAGLPIQDWDSPEVRDDLPGALASYLMSRHAPTVPLLVLGQPGSGKSVLTRVLAARLPAERFLPIRIELRHVNADADLQDHIESAIRDQTGERVQWAPFVKGRPDLLPVVILDGFDELLQATGVMQTDFLQRIERFQERELDQGRSVAVIVTTRTAVADRAVVPSGTPVIRLEPFDDEQIAAWVGIWNRKNGASLVERGVEPLSTTTIARYRELAEQPLLLLMLALYDAADNALAAIDPDLDQGSVYERLLKEFARREVMKDPGVTDVDQRVEAELLRLSVVSFAMFNRGAQWVDDESLTKDFQALGIWEGTHNDSTLRSTLSTGQKITGRFFFVHGAKTMRGERELQTYEFLHATFGEYLIARLVNRLLGELAAQRDALYNAVSYTANDGLLRALLSYDCLASRAPIMDFLTAMVDRWSAEKRASVTTVLLTLFHAAYDGRPANPMPDYQPGRMDLVKRYAIWRANLVLLAVTVGGCITYAQLFPGKRSAWAPEAHTWYGQLRSEGWIGLISRVRLTRTMKDDDRLIRLERPDIEPGPDRIGFEWTFTPTGIQDFAGLRISTDSKLAHASANLLTDHFRDLDTHSLLPLFHAASELSRSIVVTADNRVVSAGHVLLAALFAPFAKSPVPHEVTDLLAFTEAAAWDPGSEQGTFRYAAATLLVSAAEFGDLPADARGDLFDLIDSLPESRHRNVLLQRLSAAPLPPTTPTPPTPAASPTPEPSPATSSPETPATPPSAP
ncbi:NACHT domain-containing protein [Catenulispora pinisilvae]|uniref:NACHT domain-containing protein n=1 Tax=Catenulispora pinisilvae TaxID=2705253 RepID=UPI0018922F09|nr:hypothetical protein [Catenulispora pinisilvae]